MEDFLFYVYLLSPGLIVVLINEHAGSYHKPRYTNIEKILISIIFSLPVLIGNLFIVALKYASLESANLDTLVEEINNLSGLIFYTVSSLLLACLVSYCWNSYARDWSIKFINQMRSKKGKAGLNKNSVVWEDAFHRHEPQAVEVILKEGPVFGSPVNVSENVSEERCLLLSVSQEVEAIVKKYEIPVENVYIDTKSGIAVKIFNTDKFKKAYATETEAETEKNKTTC